jgi:serine/threonine protein kinase
MLAPHDTFREQYQIGYVVDDLPECVVYHAYDQQRKQQVLLAELPHPDEQALQQTLGLVNTIAAMQAKGLLPLLQHFSEGLTCYLLVDAPGAQEFGHAIREGLSPLASGTGETANLQPLLAFVSLFETLHTRQPQPILVGDLRAADLWYTVDGALALAPFALARPTAAGQTVYRAPELCEPDGKPAPTSDVYAIGAVCYYVLTGWQPPAAEQRSAGTPLPALRSIQAQIDPLLDQAVLRALELQPAERYQSVEELRYALEAAILLHAPVPAPQAAPPVFFTESPQTEPPEPAAPFTAEAAMGEDEGVVSFAGEQPAASSALLAPEVPATEQRQYQTATRPASGTTCLFVMAAALLVAAVLIGGALFYFIFGPGSTLLSSTPGTLNLLFV